MERMFRRLVDSLGSESCVAAHPNSEKLGRHHTMAPRRIRPLVRSLVVDDRFDITGTVLEVHGDQVIVLTSDLIGKPQPITVDVSYLRGLQVTPNTPIQLTIAPREHDSYLATAI